MNEGNGEKNSGPTTDELLRILIAMAGRVAMPPDRVRSIVSPSGSQKYLDAYNLCDGTVSLADVARLTGLNKANLNRSLSRWVEAGIVYKIGDDRIPKLIHIYPLPASATRDESAVPVADRDAPIEDVDSAMEARSNGKAAASSTRRSRRGVRREPSVRTEEAQLPLAVTEGTDATQAAGIAHPQGETGPS